MLLSLFWLTPPSPSKIWDEDASIAFHIGGFEVKWYGILVALGFIAAITLAIIKLKFWYKIKVDPFYYFCLMGIPLAIFGARFWSCCLGDAEWSSFFNIRDGGLAIQGGVIFDILLAIWWFPFILKKPKYLINSRTTCCKTGINVIICWCYLTMYFDWSNNWKMRKLF